MASEVRGWGVLRKDLQQVEKLVRDILAITHVDFFCYESYQRRGRPLVTAGATQKVLASLAAC